MTALPIIPESAPFTATQRLWLNGFLAGLFAQEGPAAAGQPAGPAAQVNTPLLILFGSQTGTAEALARRLAAAAKARGFQPRTAEASSGPKVDWKTENTLFIVTSTYGDGDMPDNAQGFWSWLQTDDAKALSHLSYAVLALGDSHYEHFCAAGKKFDARLEEIGAKRIHARTDCDTDYGSAADSWIENALAAVRSARPPASPNGHAESMDLSESLEARSVSVTGYSRTNPFPARLLTNRKLTGEGSGKEIRHFEISLENSGLAYDAGDALGVYPSNCPSLAGEFLHALACDGEEAVPAPGGGEVSLRKALLDCYDITKPGRELLQRVAENNPVLRELLRPERGEELKKWLWGIEVFDLFLRTPALSLAPTEFVGLLKPLAPRLYSISSSPKAHAGQVHLTVNIVRHASNGRERKGVCSSFLADRVGGQSPLPVFVQPSSTFRLPLNGDTPIIMVGPGTGIAPFRAFLHERQAVGAKGRNWLFFGEQRAGTDYYYREELEPMLAVGHLAKLSKAFSRDQADKIYVQNRMLEEAGELWAWLSGGAHFYVCGDASRMAKDVDAALHRVIETAGGKTPDEAKAYVANMRAGKRYQRDVY